MVEDWHFALTGTWRTETHLMVIELSLYEHIPGRRNSANLGSPTISLCSEPKALQPKMRTRQKEVMRVGFEPTPFRTRSRDCGNATTTLVWRLRPLGHLTLDKTVSLAHCDVPVNPRRGSRTSMRSRVAPQLHRDFTFDSEDCLLISASSRFWRTAKFAL